ncbi:D-sedoheptulose 7-phosphate isomerase [bacterium]|nr:D-sedoheptulose 7-phosphate isomerase [bacterium]
MTPQPPQADPNLVEKVRKAVLSSAEVKRRFAGTASGQIALAVDRVVTCLRGGGKLLLCGNGGSAAEAQHISAEFVGRFLIERPGLPAIALTTDTSALTAIANDYGYDAVFARQVEALGRPGDVLFAYSTSGASGNVVAALQKARDMGLGAVGFTGARGNPMLELCEVCIQAPSNYSAIIQECHSTAGHTICLLVEQLLASDE